MIRAKMAGDANPDGMTFDHRTPVCRGGMTTIDNLVLACRECNLTKGDMTAEEFVATRATA
jgi:5-methylcytosine-specific restriction endonuclease McrA